MFTIYPHIYKKLPYDPVADVTPVTLACVFDFGFAVGPMVPASVKTLADFVSWAKANPTQANFGSPAAGSTPHFVGALLGKSAGIDLKHAAYRGTQPAMQDLLGGQIAAVSGPIGDITQHLATGRIRILATSGSKRNRFAPDVPTYAEQGFKELTHSEWFAFFLPPKADAALVSRMNSALKAALASKDVVDGLAVFASRPCPTTPPSWWSCSSRTRPSGRPSSSPSVSPPTPDGQRARSHGPACTGPRPGRKEHMSFGKVCIYGAGAIGAWLGTRLGSPTAP